MVVTRRGTSLQESRTRSILHNLDVLGELLVRKWHAEEPARQKLIGRDEVVPEAERRTAGHAGGGSATFGSPARATRYALA